MIRRALQKLIKNKIYPLCPVNEKKKPRNRKKYKLTE